MSDIQEARDILAKWREAAKYEALHVATDAPAHPEQWGAWTEPGRRGWLVVGPLLNGPDSFALIVGTAGNPDLLNALDALLEAALRNGERDEPVMYAYTEDIAAAIIAADKRMQE